MCISQYVRPPTGSALGVHQKLTWTPLGPHLEVTWSPKGAQRSPLGAQRAAKTLKGRPAGQAGQPKGRPRAPTWPQLGPTWPNLAPTWTQLSPNLIPTWPKMEFKLHWERISPEVRKSLFFLRKSYDFRGSEGCAERLESTWKAVQGQLESIWSASCA